MQYTRNHSQSAGAGIPLASMCATDFLCGVMHVSEEPDGWARPRRFGPQQLRALTSCLAWHPGLFRQMAATTAGVCLRFVTDSTEIELAIRMDDEPPATAATLRGMQGTHDGISVVVDNRKIGVLSPRHSRVYVNLADPRNDPGLGMASLPGLGERHEVCMWLPCLCGCAVRELWANGTFVEPAVQNRRLLVLGDEMGQGYCCDDPAHAWPTLVAERLGLELINQSVAGQVFQPSSILDAALSHVDIVVVELGSNYRQERYDATAAASDVHAFFVEVARHWPNAQVYAIVPDWYDDAASFIYRAARGRDARVIDGAKLVADGFVTLPSGAEVLGPQGHNRFAKELLKRIDYVREVE